MYSPTSGALQLPGLGYKLERRLRTVQVHSVKYWQTNKGARIGSIFVQNGQSWKTKRVKQSSQAEDATFRWNYCSPASAHVSLLSFNLWTKRQQETKRSGSLNSSVQKRRYPVARNHLRNASHTGTWNYCNYSNVEITKAARWEWVTEITWNQSETPRIWMTIIALSIMLMTKQGLNKGLII